MKNLVVKQKIGEGGLGSIYLGEYQGINVAIK